MIPKIIHYCWFGGNPLPDLAVKCIDSWKKYCPDYEIKQWNEANFNLELNDYVKEAYASKKWAFVSDVCRLYALVNEGGIYMDTDVEVLKPLDCFLENHAFSGFESEKKIPTGIMACEKNNPLFVEFLNDYQNEHFIKQDSSIDLTTNVERITKKCLEKGFVPNNSFQIIDSFALFPKDFFCPKNSFTKELNLTKNTYTIHHFDGSWHTDEEKYILNKTAKLKRFFSYNNAHRIATLFGFIKFRGLFKGILQLLSKKVKKHEK